MVADVFEILLTLLDHLPIAPCCLREFARLEVCITKSWEQSSSFGWTKVGIRKSSPEDKCFKASQSRFWSLRCCFGFRSGNLGFAPEFICFSLPKSIEDVFHFSESGFGLWPFPFLFFPSPEIGQDQSMQLMIG